MPSLLALAVLRCGDRIDYQLYTLHAMTLLRLAAWTAKILQPLLTSMSAGRVELRMPKIKIRVLLTLVVALAFGPQTVHAQSDRSPVVEDNGNFVIPKPMEVEHNELHSALAQLMKAGRRTGEAAQAVAELLDHHFTKKNEYALPPLGLLVPLSQGKFECRMTGVLSLTDKLQADMPTMLSEHKDITQALIKLRNAAMSEGKPAIVACRGVENSPEADQTETFVIDC